MKKHKCPKCGRCMADKLSDNTIVCCNVECLEITVPKIKKERRKWLKGGTRKNGRI
jgi:hypothetical protein